MSRDQPTDEELIKAANRGDREALSLLCGRYLSWAVRVAFGVLARFPDAQGEAESAAQQALIAFVALFPGFPPTDSPKQAIFGLAVREARRLRDKLRRKREHAGDCDLPTSPNEPDDPLRRDIVRLSIESLPERLREIIVMRYWLPAPVREIAAAFDLPVGTVKSRLHEAFETLRSDPRLAQCFRDLVT